MKKLIVAAILATSSVFACTNVMVNSGTSVAVGRTMDFAVNMGNKMGFGMAGAKNSSNVNMFQDEPTKAATWVNKYAYLGQTAFQTYAIVDGINSAGLYAGFLYLPGVTQYPKFNPSDARAELGVLDSANYVLGTSATVEEAIENLKNIQFVTNALPLNVGMGKIEYLPFPVHLVIRDKKGSSLLIEWAGGNVKSYYHKVDSNQTIESTNFKDDVVHSVFNMSSVTNAPEYSWHIQNVKQYDKLFNGNSDFTINGLYMNGSGFMGLPGDYTPPSRLARVYTMAKFMPKPNNQREAEASAYGLLDSVVTSVASAPDSTLWVSVSNLKDNVYYWKPMISSTVKNGVIKVAPFTISSAKVIRFDLKQLKNALGIPRGFLNANVSTTAGLNKEQSIKALEFLKSSSTKGPLRANIVYESNLAEFDKNEFDTTNMASGVMFP